MKNATRTLAATIGGLHNDRFQSLMDTYLPQWQFLRDELNHEPLAYEDREY